MIFLNKNALSSHHVPDKLPCRETQIYEIKNLLQPLSRNQRAQSLFIYGKTGTGKTCTIKYVMRDFNIPLVDFTYLNCRIYNSRYRVIQRVLKTFSPEVEKSGFGLTFLYERLLSLMNEGRYFVVVLDEIDMVRDLDDLIYTLIRSNDEANKGGLSIVGISNKLSFKENLGPRTKSSLSEREMVFPPYTVEELVAILKERVTEGFVEGCVDHSAINITAALASREGGDVRYALKLLVRGGEIVEMEGLDVVTDKEIEKAREDAEMDVIAEAISTLPEQQQFLLYAISDMVIRGSKYRRLGEEHDLLFSGEVYEAYSMVCKKFNRKQRSSRWYREYLNDLEMLGVITTAESGRGIRGQTTLIKLGVSAEKVKSLLERSFINL